MGNGTDNFERVERHRPSRSEWDEHYGRKVDAAERRQGRRAERRSIALGRRTAAERAEAAEARREAATSR